MDSHNGVTRTEHGPIGSAISSNGSPVDMSDLRAALLAAERDLARVRELEADLDEAREIVEALRDAETSRLDAESGRWHAEIALSVVEARARAIEAERDDWIKLYGDLVNSASWKVTAPLRSLAALVRRVRG